MNIDMKHDQIIRLQDELCNVFSADVNTTPDYEHAVIDRVAHISVPLPIVIIVGGVARGGKNTFVDMCTSKYSYERGEFMGLVRSLSTVDLCYKAINDTLLKNDTRAEVVDAVKNKSDEWRQFMHEVKMSWTKFCDGPSNYILQQLNDAVMGPINLSKTDQSKPELVFVQLREVDETRKLKKMLNDAGYLCLAVFIDGSTTTNDFNNGCDHNIVYDPEVYDVLIENKGTLNDLLEKCDSFIAKLLSFKSIHKIPSAYVPVVVETAEQE